MVRLQKGILLTAGLLLFSFLSILKHAEDTKVESWLHLSGILEWYFPLLGLAITLMVAGLFKSVNRYGLVGLLVLFLVISLLLPFIIT